MAVIGAHGAGKTTLIERLVPALRRLGRTVAVIKHHAHAADPDVTGSDTARYGAAGASRTVLAGPGAVVVRYPAGEEPDLDVVLGTVGAPDLILLEGYSRSALPKILVTREGVQSDRPDPAGPVVAVVVPPPPGQPDSPALVFGWDQTDALAAWLSQAAPAIARSARGGPARQAADG